MNKAEKMKKLALSMKNYFIKKGSFADKRLYRSCLKRIKTEAKKGKFKWTFLISEYDDDIQIDVEMVAAWLEKDGFEVSLKSFYENEIDEEVEDWEMKVSWE